MPLFWHSPEHVTSVVLACHLSVSCRWLTWWWCVPLLTLDFIIRKKQQQSNDSNIQSYLHMMDFNDKILKTLYDNYINFINVGFKVGMKLILQLSKPQCIFDIFFGSVYGCTPRLTVMVVRSFKKRSLQQQLGSVPDSGTNKSLMGTNIPLRIRYWHQTAHHTWNWIQVLLNWLTKLMTEMKNSTCFVQCFLWWVMNFFNQTSFSKD